MYKGRSIKENKQDMHKTKNIHAAPAAAVVVFIASTALVRGGVAVVVSCLKRHNISAINLPSVCTNYAARVAQEYFFFRLRSCAT